MTAFERLTARLRLRRPRADDLEAYVALHTDPRTYRHAPDSMPDAARCEQRLAGDLRDWERRGWGQVAVERLDDDRTRRLVGWGGLRLIEDGPHAGDLNLYYRLAHDVLGQGLGRELARALVAAAIEELPDLQVLALVKPHNAAWLATARSAGLVETGFAPNSEDRADDPPSVVLRAPTYSSTTVLDQALREEVLDLWVRVNDADGAVGFQPGAPRDVVAAALAVHEAVMVDGRGHLGLLRAPDGALLGLGFWQREAWWGHAHILKLWRLMVDPAQRRRGTGRLLMAGMHGLAGRLPDVELLRLDYRGGRGTGDFYASLGWVETGRQPSGLRLSPTDRRDEVSMMRRPDGTRLRHQGGT